MSDNKSSLPWWTIPLGVFSLVVPVIGPIIGTVALAKVASDQFNTSSSPVDSHSDSIELLTKEIDFASRVNGSTKVISFRPLLFWLVGSVIQIVAGYYIIKYFFHGN